MKTDFMHRSDACAPLPFHCPAVPRPAAVGGAGGRRLLSAELPPPRQPQRPRGRSMGLWWCRGRQPAWLVRLCNRHGGWCKPRGALCGRCIARSWGSGVRGGGRRQWGRQEGEEGRDKGASQEADPLPQARHALSKRKQGEHQAGWHALLHDPTCKCSQWDPGAAVLSWLCPWNLGWEVCAALIGHHGLASVWCLLVFLVASVSCRGAGAHGVCWQLESVVCVLLPLPANLWATLRACVWCV